ncbi:MAG TPA: hypothetical protein VHW00_03605 [Thermoanaerobaculia bacterium]|nr:hypothetical protein [Thermoanaerobaculia bacterium]
MKVRFLVVLAMFLCLASCRTLEKSKAKQLSRVAKDWCLTIRASQVLPAYPLTEDLQVGDVFLVSTPLEEEVHDLEEDGFLPLDNVIARLQPTGWQQFYNGAYSVTDTSTLPKQWQFPTPAPTSAPFTQWSVAPGAAFPSYTFQIKSGSGASLAIPIQSVPVGLTLLQTADAYGTVNIASASTYGLPITTLTPQIEAWALANQDFLRQYAPHTKRTRRGKTEEQSNYVRVVYRVYVAGGVNVSLISNQSRGARVDAGASVKTPALFDAGGATNESVNAATNYSQVLQSLSQSVAAATPGASVQLASVSSRSVAMNETFPRPLVIGYLAFDREILPDGHLGPALPTHARVSGEDVNEAVTVAFGEDKNTGRIRSWLEASPANRDRLNSWLSSNAPNTTIAVLLNSDQNRQLRANAVVALAIP